jgi:hypothetical protein
MNHAVDVVGDKIELQLGIKGCVVRGGRKQYLKDLKQYLDQLLRYAYEDGGPDQFNSEGTKGTGSRNERLERRFHRRNNQNSLGTTTVSRPRGGVVNDTECLHRLSSEASNARGCWEKLECADQRMRKTMRLARVITAAHKRYASQAPWHQRFSPRYTSAYRVKRPLPADRLQDFVDRAAGR